MHTISESRAQPAIPQTTTTALADGGGRRAEEDMHTAAVRRLAEALAERDAANERCLDHWCDDDVERFYAQRRRATDGVLAAAQIVVRRYQLTAAS